jgi:hypothetical protein
VNKTCFSKIPQSHNPSSQGIGVAIPLQGLCIHLSKVFYRFGYRDVSMLARWIEINPCRLQFFGFDGPFFSERTDFFHD